MTGRIYVGTPDGTVTVTETRHSRSHDLDLRLDLIQADCGTSQIACALLADVLADDRMAVALMHPFASAVLSHLPAGEVWAMSDTVVRSVADSIAAG